VFLTLTGQRAEVLPPDDEPDEPDESNTEREGAMA
jgi:hypothetical protein